jgi:RNA polymerase sigma factor (sigma-70 family)
MAPKRPAFERSQQVRPGPDFVDVYRTQLAAVWRYVRSRVSSRYDAEDLTSEVFARAWRSWGHYDAGRGEVAPWLLTIAQRAVADWHRRHGGPHSNETLDIELIDGAISDPAELPETVLLAKEVLIEVNQALAELSDRERDGIALRFGAGLKIADVGRVLGLSTAATKMMLARSMTKVAAKLAQRKGRQLEEAPLVLDDLVDQALQRGGSVLPTPELGNLVFQLAVIHRPAMPAELPRQVQVCVDCATTALNRLRARRRQIERSDSSRRFSVLSSAFAWAPLSPICLACTLPVLITPLLALGMSLDVAYTLHALSLLTAPLVALVIWRHFERHRVLIAALIGFAGAGLLITHLVGHIVVMDGVPGWSVVADRAGTGLLLAATVIDAIALNRWVLRQRMRLAVAAADFLPAPA